MPKEEWGVKRVCPTTGKRFYDLNKNPIISPYTGEVVEVDTGKRRTITADAADGAIAQDEEVQGRGRRSATTTTRTSMSISTTMTFSRMTRTTTTCRSTRSPTSRTTTTTDLA